MKDKNLISSKLVASDGHILTDGENYGRIVYLACGEASDKWYEITDEEYETKTKECYFDE